LKTYPVSRGESLVVTLTGLRLESSFVVEITSGVVTTYLIGTSRDAKHVAATGKFKTILGLAIERLGQRKDIFQPRRLASI
jgi:hypothetical protein